MPRYLLTRPVSGVAWVGGWWQARLAAKMQRERAFDRAVDEYLAEAKFYKPLPKRKRHG